MINLHFVIFNANVIDIRRLTSIFDQGAPFRSNLNWIDISQVRGFGWLVRSVVERIKVETTFLVVQEKLLRILQSENFDNNKLHSEEELVELLDASRGTVREVLRSLARKGVISKKHGIGNFVHPRTLNMKMRFDEITDFIHLIEDGGYEASLVKDRDPADYYLPQDGSAGSFEKFLDKDLEYLCFTRIYLADGKPCVYCQLFFPKHLLTRPPFSAVTHDNLIDFVKSHFDQDIEQAMVWINPETASQEIAEKFDLAPGTAVLAWDELFCNYKDEIIGYSKTHFNPDIMNVCMLKKSS
jgi:GntR family transcriptional regulator